MWVNIMFLHLGNDVYVNQKDIVAVCNLDTASVYKNTQIYLKKAEEMGADYIAMGHYARVIHDGDKHYLLRGVDSNKDQTYFLSQLTSAQLSKALFPVGELT